MEKYQVAIVIANCFAKGKDCFCRIQVLFWAEFLPSYQNAENIIFKRLFGLRTALTKKYFFNDELKRYFNMKNFSELVK